MKLSDKIANCPICWEYAKSIDSVNADELFQQAWLDVWQYQNNNPDKSSQVMNHQNYFYGALKRKYWYNKRTKRYYVSLDQINESKIQTSEEVTPDIPSEAFILEWISSKPENEIDMFYKNIITLVLRCKSIRDATRMCEIHPNRFYEYLKNAKQKLKDDFILSTNPNDIRGDIMV